MYFNGMVQLPCPIKWTFQDSCFFMRLK
jgi:hypothetical protein